MCLFGCFIAFSLYFPALVPPQTTLLHPFPAFGSSPEHHIISLTQSQDPFPLHPIRTLIPLKAVPTLSL